MRNILIAACIAAMPATPIIAAPADTKPYVHLTAGGDSAERDKRRRGFVPGHSCSFISHGQPMTLVYETGGAATLRWQEANVDFRWSLENDQFCLWAADSTDKRCGKLPKRDMKDERGMIENLLKRGCL